MPYLIPFLIFGILSGGLVWLMVKQDQGDPEPIWALWLAFGLGFAGALMAIFLEKLLINQQSIDIDTDLKVSLLSVIGVGLIEEACKFLPLALAIYNRKFFNEHTDGVMYFALAGLGFGLPENIAYTVIFGAQTGFQRAILTPFFHASMTAIVGYFLAKNKISKKPAIAILPVFLLAALTHALYDFGLAGDNGLLALLSVLLTVCLSTSLFVIFFRAKAKDQAMGLSANGHNDFCRACGFPNAKHTLYCTNCGKNT